MHSLSPVGQWLSLDEHRWLSSGERHSPKAYAKNAFGITGGEEPIKVRLLFEPKLAVYITERQWHPSQEFRMRRDARVEMRFETTGRKQVIRWVLSWMPDVKVLSPKSLRDRVCEKLEAGLRSQ
jgi:predicted DNA-binding transcriptional regulator YafY